MNVDAIAKRTKLRVGLGAKQDKPGFALSKKEEAAISRMRQVWLSTALQIINSSSEPTAWGVTSAVRGEGKSTNCLGLAATLAQEIDERVLVVECDLESTSVASQLGMKSAPGLVEYLDASSPAKEVVRHTHIPNLDAIFAGGASPQLPRQPYLSRLRRRLPGILTALKSSYRFILLDMPPVLTNPYTSDMVNHTDGAFFAVMAGVTPVASMAQAVKELDGDKLAGVILIGADAPLPGWVMHLLYE